MKNVIVLAGGPSVRKLNPLTIIDELPRFGFTIGVNDSAIHARVDVGLSMDRLWCEHRWHRVVNEIGVPLYAREAACKNIAPHPLIRKFRCDHTATRMDPTDKVMNGGNSGMVAMNLAFTLAPAQVFLFGMDCRKLKGEKPYWYPSYSWANPCGGSKSGKYFEWEKQFGYVAKQFEREGIKVYTVGETALKCFENLSFHQFTSKAADYVSDHADLSILQQSIDAGAPN